MRTIIDLPEESLRALDAWAKAQQISRAEAVRRAVDGLLARVARPRGYGFGVLARPRESQHAAMRRTNATLKALRKEWPD